MASRCRIRDFSRRCLWALGETTIFYATCSEAGPSTCHHFQSNRMCGHFNLPATAGAGEIRAVVSPEMRYPPGLRAAPRRRRGRHLGNDHYGRASADGGPIGADCRHLPARSVGMKYTDSFPRIRCGARTGGRHANQTYRCLRFNSESCSLRNACNSSAKASSRSHCST